MTGTHFNYYHICHRKLWLFANGIQMEHTSDLVSEGKLIHENSYPQRSEKYEELEIDGIKLDYYDTAKKIIHETKKSDKIEEAHEWQLKYYILVLERNGIEGVSGILEYPTLRQKNNVTLSESDRVYIKNVIQDIEAILNSDSCPPRLESKICKNCSYFEFCYVGED